MKNRIKNLVFITSFLPLLAFAGQTQIGRYLTVTDEPTLAQTSPLSATFQLTFPDSVITIGDAINYLLASTSYQIIPAKYRNDELNELLKKRLPLSDKTLGPATVKTALSALAGNSYLMLIDPKHRYIAFVLKPQFKKLY